MKSRKQLCDIWRMLLRIVRTNEGVGVRLRYGGEPDDSGTCSKTGIAINIGLNVYNSLANLTIYEDYKVSDIKIKLEEWYEEKIWKNRQNTEVTSLIADPFYCADITGFSSSYGAYMETT